MGQIWDSVPNSENQGSDSNAPIMLFLQITTGELWLQFGTVKIILTVFWHTNRLQGLNRARVNS